MNGIVNHEQACLANLEDKTAWLALVDHHAEALDLPYRIALRAVATMRRNERRHRDYQRAAKLIEAADARARAICQALRCHFQSALTWHAIVRVVPGRMRPQLHAPQVTTDPPAAGSIVITAGALYVLHLDRLATALQRIDAAAYIVVVDSLRQLP